MAIQRASTGVKGLDKMLEGGIPRTYAVILAGGPGTGKTLLGMQFLYAGAKQGEKGIFVSLEEKPERIVNNAKSAFSGLRDLHGHIKKGTIGIEKIDKWTFEQFVERIQTSATENKPQRAFIDSIGVIESYFEKPAEYRRKLFDLVDYLSASGCTVMMSQEASAGLGTWQANREVARYVVDGVILLHDLEKEQNRTRAIQVIKMRGTGHDRTLVPMKIEPRGIEVYHGDKLWV